MIGGQLHDEGSRIPGEHLRLLQHDAGDDDGPHADEVGGYRDPGAAAEKGAGDEADDGHLRPAGDEAGGHDGHAPVPLVLNGAGGHDAGDAAARADEHGDEALARKPELAENAVHDEGDSGHIAAVLQDGQQQEQHQHLGHEAQHRAHSGADTVGNEAHQPAGHAPALQQSPGAVREPGPAQGIVCPVREEGADGDAPVPDGRAHAEGIDQIHDHCEDGQGQDAVGNDPVDLVGTAELMDLLFLIDALEHLGDIDIPLIGDDALRVVLQLRLGGGDVLFDVSQDLFVDVQLFQHLLVPLEDLHGIPPLLFFGETMEGRFLDVGDGVVHRTGESVLGNGLAALGRLDGSFGGFLDALALQGGDLQHRAAQLPGQLPEIDAVPLLPHQVHHVHGHHHGDAQLRELGGEVEVPLQVRAVHDIQDGVGPVVDEVIPGHHFLQRIGGQGIDAGQVGDGHVVVLFQLALFLLYRDAGPVAHILGGTGEGVEQRRLAAVGVARQGDLHFHSYAPFTS